MHNESITPEAIKEFEGNAVWEEMVLRMAQKQDTLFSKIIDPMNETDKIDKITYAVYEEVRGYPKAFLEEIKQLKEEQLDEQRRTEKGTTGAAKRI
ncbi:MAG: hypothetical protein NWE76_05185 [Candidatus Bathyarchaeota archaeon]|nr:hypothetical protein [Candidatus Bathyarchaeota archaeon]